MASGYKLDSATPAEELVLSAAYRAELLYTVPRRKQGSWVAMCFDDRGRIVETLQRLAVVVQVNAVVFLELLDQVIHHAQVEIVAAEESVAVGGHDFELVLAFDLGLGELPSHPVGRSVRLVDLVERHHDRHGAVLCGREPVVGEHHSRIRVQPRHEHSRVADRQPHV